MNLVIRLVFPTDCSPRKTSLYLRRVGVVVLLVLVALVLAGVCDSSISTINYVADDSNVLLEFSDKRKRKGHAGIKFK